MNRLSTHALVYVGVAILVGSFSLTGAALLGYGLQAELAQWMSGGAAAILVGGALVGAPAVFLAVRNANAKKRHSTDAPEEPNPQISATIAGSTLTSTVSAVARSMFIGLAARRPMAMLGLAALVGALVSIKPDAEKCTSSDQWRKRASAAT